MNIKDLSAGQRVAYNDRGNAGRQGAFDVWDDWDREYTREAEVLSAEVVARVEYTRYDGTPVYRRNKDGVLVRIKQANGRWGPPVAVLPRHLRCNWAEFLEQKAEVEGYKKAAATSKQRRIQRDKALVKQIRQIALDRGFEKESVNYTLDLPEYDYEWEKGKVTIKVADLARLLGLDVPETDD